MNLKNTTKISGKFGVRTNISPLIAELVYVWASPSVDTWW